MADSKLSISQSLPPINTFPEDISPEMIHLEPEDITWGRQQSQGVEPEAQRWQVYLNALAIRALERWLREVAPALGKIDYSLLQPDSTGFLPGVCHLSVKSFQMGLIAIDHPVAQPVEIPKAVVELPKFAAHFYLLAEVQEDLEQVILWGYLRHDQLASLLQTVHPMRLASSLSESWQWSLPADCFQTDLYRCLTDIRYLSPSLIPVPLPVRDIRPYLHQLATALAHQWPDLGQPDLPLCEILHWEQARMLAQCPPLLQLLHQARRSPHLRIRAIQQAQALLARLSDSVTAVAGWLEGFPAGHGAGSWSPPQPLAPVAVRRTTNRFEAAIADIQKQTGVEIPPAAIRAYQDVPNTTLQVHLITWTQTRQDGWSFWLVVTPQPGTTLRPSTRLQVIDTTPPCDVFAQTGQSYLYTPIIDGEWDEAFFVTLTPPDDLPITLPPLVWKA